MTRKSAAVFVDVQNIYYTTRQAFGRKFDYRKLWQKLTDEFDIVIANAYAIHRGDDQQLKFQNALKTIGFTVKLKPYIQRKDGSAKGDWDVGITIDIMEYSSKSDIIVLASGDGDFDILISRIRTLHNNEIEIYGVANLTANSLKNIASNFFPISHELLLS